MLCTEILGLAFTVHHLAMLHPRDKLRNRYLDDKDCDIPSGALSFQKFGFLGYPIINHTAVCAGSYNAKDLEVHNTYLFAHHKDLIVLFFRHRLRSRT